MAVLQAALDIARREGCLRHHKHHKPFGGRKSALLPIPVPVPLASLEVLKEATFPCLFCCLPSYVKCKDS